MIRPALVVLLILPLFALSQAPDCDKAIALKKDQTYQAKHVEGYGSTLEIANNALGSKFYFTEEHNTVWYIINADYDGILTLDIVPDNAQDDWDFLLFKVVSEDICSRIKDRAVKPVRSNLARNDIKNGGKTGLAKSGVNPYEVAGPNSNYSKPIRVSSNSTYLLVVDNNGTTGNGHEVTYQIEKEIKDTIVEIKTTSPIMKEIEWTKQKEATPQTHYQFKVFDESSKQPLACNIKIVIEKGFGQDSIINFENKDAFDLDIEQSNNFSINITKEGYLFYSKNFRSKREEADVKESFYLPQAKAGEMISLPDINFKENTTHLLTSSINALQEIHDFMVNNPQAEIEIRGHVNAPGYENNGKVKRFSEKRAEEVKNFLVGMGLDGKRIKTSGWGNEFMIYPSPNNYEQEKANRRVEIKILKN